MPVTRTTQPERSTPSTHTPDHHVVIIGAGFGGIGAAVELRRAGIEDFVILEKWVPLARLGRPAVVIGPVVSTMRPGGCACLPYWSGAGAATC